MRKMKDSGVEWIGEIPADWKLSKIGSVYDERNEKVSDKDFAPLSVAKQGIVPQLETAAKTDNGDNRKLIRKNDFVINSRSDRRGSCGISEYEGSCSLINIVLKPQTNVCNRYYGFVFKSDSFADEYYRWGHGIVDDLWSTKWTDMKSIYIPVPDIVEQEKIADYLDAKCSKIDKIIEKQQAIIEKLKEYKLSIITEVVTKGLNPDVEMMESGAEFVGKIPQNWSIAKLGNLFDFIGGYAFNSEMYVSESQNQVVRIGNVKNGYMLLDSNPVFVNDETAERANKFLIKPNYILFTMTGTKGKRDYFFTHVVTEEDCKGKRLYINQRVGCFVAKKGVHPAYYGYLLKDNKILDGIFLYETGTANQGNIGIDSISRTKVHVPPYEEQCKIAEYLDKKCNMIDSNIYEKGRLIIKFQEYKKSLIYEVVTGKKEV